MRSVLDLLDLPYAYWQLPLLTEDQFRREANARGVHLFERQLEGFHRLRLLTPFLRVRRDGRRIAAAARRGDPYVWEAAHWEPTNRRDLLDARAAGRLHDPSTEHFIARRRLRREIGELSYRSSEYLYSHHQLLAIPTLRLAQSHLRYSAGGSEVVGFDGVYPLISGHWRSRAKWLHPRLIAIIALEPIYYPEIVRRIRYNSDELEKYDAWRQELSPQAMLDWLEVDADWVRESARALLAQADQIDPLGRWLEVVREADPPHWELLQGEARNAVDLRIGAEILLRYYDRPARSGLAPKIEPSERRGRDEFGGRLRPMGGLDRTLTDFGLSPHPSVILVVEGETELFIFPRLMEMAGVRQDRDFIAIESTQGVNKNVAALIAYAVAPQTERDGHDRYLRLNKPLTRLLAIMDAEGQMATPEGRKRRREAWIKRILDTLPSPDRTASVRESIERLVAVDTWNRKGESFEFAHFSDRELAMAIDQVDQRQNAPVLGDRIKIVGRIRASRGNLDSALGGRSKLALAKALWPILKRKIERAERRGTERNIPIVGVLDQATDMARELPRRNVVIPLREQA